MTCVFKPIVCQAPSMLQVPNLGWQWVPVASNQCQSGAHQWNMVALRPGQQVWCEKCLSAQDLLFNCSVVWWVTVLPVGSHACIGAQAWFALKAQGCNRVVRLLPLVLCMQTLSTTNCCVQECQWMTKTCGTPCLFKEGLKSPIANVMAAASQQAPALFGHFTIAFILTMCIHKSSGWLHLSPMFCLSGGHGQGQGVASPWWWGVSEWDHC